MKSKQLIVLFILGAKIAEKTTHCHKHTKNIQSLKHHHENCHFLITLFKNEIAVVLDHDLAREAQADAGAVGFGGVEWNKDLVDLPQRDGFAVVRHTDDGLVLRIEVGGDADGVGTCLYCILDQIVEHQHHLSFVGKDKEIVSLCVVG